MADLATELRIAPLTGKHVAAVLDLINADRLPGQPECTHKMLAEARAGRSPIDAGWWEELGDVAVRVVTDAASQVRGVVSFAVRERDRTGFVLWLHAREDPAVVGILLDHALTELADCTTVEAFAFATALGLGLEALPVRHRPTTHAALLTRGFVAADLWRYMHRRLPAWELPRVTFEVRPAEDKTGRVLEVVEHGVVVGEATIGKPVVGIGPLWWISVKPEARGQGLGLKLLGSALAELTRWGAEEAILYVDDDAPADDPERSRRAANAMYDRAGFIEVDRLYSYTFSR
jgi:ribosomal protein S18 acetylase RimI-like enzyme